MARLCELKPVDSSNMGPKLDEASLWPMLLEASRHAWSDRPVWTSTETTPRLTIEAGGTWHCDSEHDDSAAALLDALVPLATARRIVIGQLGQSLDGRIATRTGHSHYINGEAALTHLHRLRALVDVVLVGAETACADRPRLNVRHVEGVDPVCAIVDPAGRVPADGPLFEEGCKRTVLHIVGTDARPGRVAGHVERLPLPAKDGRFSPADILAALAAKGLNRVLVEGGASTISGFIDAGVLDRLHLLIAPLIIGSGRNGLELPPIDRLEQARRPTTRSFAIGEELLVDVDLSSG